MSWRIEDELSRLNDALEPDDLALRRVRARAHALGQPRRIRGPLALGLVVVAALALLWFAVPSTLNARLDSPVIWRDEALSAGVDLRFQGQGHADGAPRSPVIRWESGTVDLEVEPGQGLNVRVQTEEAEVLVIGTRFTVARDALGTAVAVQRGRVSVTCSEGTVRFLVPGQRLFCARSAAASLAYARANTSADPAELLDILQRGLAVPDADDAVRDELRFLSIAPLEALGRDREALATAESALEGGDPPRWRALRAAAARLRVADGDCPGALPHLDALSAAGDDAVALVLLADCVSDADPARARESLDRALALPLNPDQRAQVQARLDALQK